MTENLPWRQDERWRRRYPTPPGPDPASGMPQGSLDPYRTGQYGQFGNAARSGHLAPWQRKVMTGFVVGVAVLATLSVALIVFG